MKKKGYEVNRADNLSQPGIITHQIIDELIEADLVIADLTSFNPNVFYELSVRHAAEKPIIHMIEWGQDIPFDIANFRTIFYGIRIDQAEKAKSELESQVTSILNDPFVPNNPIVAAKRFADIQKNLKSGVKTDSQDVLLLLLEKVSNIESKSEKLNYELSKRRPQENFAISENQWNNNLEYRVKNLSNERAATQAELNYLDNKIIGSISKKKVSLASNKRMKLIDKLSALENEINALKDQYEISVR